MSHDKKLMREKFRSAVFKRDKNRCRICGWSLVTEDVKLDAHHITDRNKMPNGGYVVTNGITLCPECHIKAEHYHSTGEALKGFSPEDLYRLIGSSIEKAAFDSSNLKD